MDEGWLFVSAVDLVPLVLTLVFAATMLVAIVWDIATYEIPDSLSVILLVVGVGALLAGQGWSGLVSHALGAAVVFAVGVTMFALGQWGGGDVKFMAASSLWLGWPVLVGYVLWVAIAGGVLGVLVLAFRRWHLPEAWQERPWLARLHRAGQGLPYGVALGAGGLVMLHPAIVSVFRL